MQLVHSAWNLQTGGGGSIELNTFRKLWQENFNSEEDEKFKKMNCPVLTRWYLVGLATEHLLQNWDKWLVLAKQIRNAYTSIAAPNKCASALISLMLEPLLRAHAGFVHGFHRGWWNTQYVFFTKKDELTKAPGKLYLSHYII